MSDVRKANTAHIQADTPGEEKVPQLEYLVEWGCAGAECKD